MNLLPPPGKARTRQLGLLALTAVALIGVLWYSFGTSEAPPPATTPAAAQSKTPAAAAAAALATSNSQSAATANAKNSASLPTPLKLDQIGVAPEPGPADSTRNPFKFGEPPPPPKPPTPTYVPPPQPVGPPPPPPIPPVPLKCEGVVTVQGNRMAMLRDTQTQAPFQAPEDSVVDGRYRLVKIGLDSVVVSYLDGSGMRTVRIER